MTDPTQTMPLAAIRLDGGTQTRAAMNQGVIEQYAEAMQLGYQFPPIIVYDDGEDRWLADGYHRYYAHRTASRTEIECEVRPGSRADALIESVRSNHTHGLRRTNADKRRSVELLVELNKAEGRGWSNREMAEMAGVGHTLVNEMARELGGEVESDSTRSESTTDSWLAPEHGSEPEPEAEPDVTADPEPPAPTKPIGPPPVLDAANARVPSHLEPQFITSRDISNDVLRPIGRVRKRCDELVDTLGPQVFEVGAIKQAWDSLERKLKLPKPHTVCIDCQGQGSDRCGTCAGKGWLTRKQYADLSKIAKAGT